MHLLLFLRKGDFSLSCFKSLPPCLVSSVGLSSIPDASLFLTCFRTLFTSAVVGGIWYSLDSCSCCSWANAFPCIILILKNHKYTCTTFHRSYSDLHLLHRPRLGCFEWFLMYYSILIRSPIIFISKYFHMLNFFFQLLFSTCSLFNFLFFSYTPPSSPRTLTS